MSQVTNLNGLGKSFLYVVISDNEVTVDMKDALHRVARDLSDRGFVSLTYEGERVRVRLETDNYRLGVAANLPENAHYRAVLSDAKLVELSKRPNLGRR